MAILITSKPTGLFESPILSEKSKPHSSSEKLSQAFKNQNVAAVCTVNQTALPSKRVYRSIGGMLGGSTLSSLCATTGPTVALHEVVGHGLLGFKLTNHYGSGARPHFQIDGFDNFQEIGKAKSFQEGIIAFYNWIRGYDCAMPGSSGLAYPGQPDGPNQLGQAMGRDGQSAWVSITGSLPGLALDSLSVVAGMGLRKHTPALSSLLIAMGISDHLISSYYPMTAAFMSPSELQNRSNVGHDFANIAVHMSKVTGLPAQALAISLATIWTAFVPLVALISYLHSKSHTGDLVPDALAVKQWIKKAETDPKIAEELERHLASYPQKDSLLQLANMLPNDGKPLSEDQIEKIQAYAIDFVVYLLDQVPSKSFEKEKLEILDSWQKLAKPDRIQNVSLTISITSNIATVATKIFQVLSMTIAPTLSIASSILTYTTPAFATVSALSFGHRVYKDFKCPDSAIPKSAKMLSIAMLVTNVACAALIAVATFVAGLNMALFGTLIIGTIANIALDYAHSRIIQKQLLLSQALQPEVKDVMHALWVKHQTLPAGAKMGNTLKNWANLVHPEKELKSTQVQDHSSRTYQYQLCRA